MKWRHSSKPPPPPLTTNAGRYQLLPGARGVLWQWVDKQPQGGTFGISLTSVGACAWDGTFSWHHTSQNIAGHARIEAIMPINNDLIAKSDENWQCVDLLIRSQLESHNAAASRMYYSVFLLVKSAMARNYEDPDMPQVAKMSMDAATGVHRLAIQYLDSLRSLLGAALQKVGWSACTSRL